MSTLKTRDKAILEKAFWMGGGYVLDFSDRTMEAFFAEEFDIAVYDKKYDFDFPSKSKANRMRGIWQYESDEVVSKIILALVDYAETVRLTKGHEISEQEVVLFQKAREIASNLAGSTPKPHISQEPVSFTSTETISPELQAEVKKIFAPEDVIEGISKLLETEQELIRERKNEVVELIKYHQSYIDVLEVFCADPSKPSFKLNGVYQKLANHIYSILNSLQLEYHKVDFYRPFADLYSAEVDWWGKYGGHTPIRWDDIRPQLYKAHSDIMRLVNIATQEDADEEDVLLSATELVNTHRKETKSADDVQKVEILHKYEKEQSQSISLSDFEIGFIYETAKVTFGTNPALRDKTISISFCPPSVFVSASMARGGFCSVGAPAARPAVVLSSEEVAICDPTGNRTPVTGMRILCPSR